jgi:CBS domain containing-hemolysin-like protein
VKFFLAVTILCILVQGFYGMLEMAAVSFNRVRLQYYVSKRHRRALWLSYLLKHPALLFGTTLIMVNLSLLLGSECSRRFYLSLGLSPDWAPLTQVVLVLVFADLSPLFAGRRYAEHAAMLGIPLLYVTSLLLRPLIWVFDLICRGVNRLVGSQATGVLYLSREELQRVVEEREEVIGAKPERDEFDTTSARILSLKNKSARELMKPLQAVQMIPSACTIGDMRAQLTAHYTPFLPIYHKVPQNIVSIAYPRDLLRCLAHQQVKEHARPPWFITEGQSVLQILKQFRSNNQSVAVVLSEAGLAVGILTLDEIIDEIFGRMDQWMAYGDVAPRMYRVVLDRTFPGEMRLADFNVRYGVHLLYEDAETLEEVMAKALGHPPTKGESVRIDQFELTVEEASLLGVKVIAVHTIY